MIKYIFHIILGWKIIGYSKLPTKCIVIAAPHTHWLDLFLGLAIRNSVGEDIKFIGKKELFIFPLNYIMRYIGGIPVNRNSKTKNVDQIATLIQNSNNFKLAISPEGTRKKVTKWKTGFYYIALEAEIPVLLVHFNYPHKKVSFLKLFYPTGDIDNDIKEMKAYFKRAA